MIFDYFKNKKLIIIVITILILYPRLLPAPIKTEGYAVESINTSIDPYQKPSVKIQPKIIVDKNKTIIIHFICDYEVSALIVSKCNYWFDWKAKLIPIDLALAWGHLVRADYKKYINYWQFNRWYYYRYKGGSPWGGDYISSHSSNHHLIPANQNIRKAIQSSNVNQIVKLTGYLVNLDMISTTGKEEHLLSSQSRTDTGGGACEVMYVTKVQIDDNLYE